MATKVPDPDGTARKCRFGCGLMTVLGQLGDGRWVRVHCGTWRPSCPQPLPTRRGRGSPRGVAPASPSSTGA